MIPNAVRIMSNGAMATQNVHFFLKEEENNFYKHDGKKNNAKHKTLNVKTLNVNNLPILRVCFL